MKKKSRDHDEIPEVRETAADRYVGKSLEVANEKSIADHRSIHNSIKEQLESSKKRQDQDHEYRLFTASTNRLVLEKEIESLKLEQMKIQKSSCCIQ
jgi:hypothetical protein